MALSESRQLIFIHPEYGLAFDQHLSLVGFSNPASWLSKVLFPEPDVPKIQQISPLLIVRLMFFKAITCSSPSHKPCSILHNNGIWLLCFSFIPVIPPLINSIAFGWPLLRFDRLVLHYESHGSSPATSIKAKVSGFWCFANARLLLCCRWGHRFHAWETWCIPLPHHYPHLFLFQCLTDGKSFICALCCCIRVHKRIFLIWSDIFTLPSFSSGIQTLFLPSA